MSGEDLAATWAYVELVGPWLGILCAMSVLDEALPRVMDWLHK